jgi:tryptophan-rich sensory protein
MWLKLRRPSRAVSPDFDHTPGRITQGLVAIWVFAFAGVVAPTALVQATPPATDRLWVAALGFCVLAAARFAWIVGDGRRRLYEMTFWIYSYSFLGLAPLVQSRTRVWPGTTPDGDWSYTTKAMTVVVVGTLAFLVGVLIAERRGHQPGKPFLHLPSIVLLNRRVVYGVAAFSLIANLYFLSQTQIIQFTQSRYDPNVSFKDMETAASTGTIVQSLAAMSLLVAFVALVRERQLSKSGLQKGISGAVAPTTVGLVLTIIVGLSLLNTLNPISNARYIAGTALLASATVLGLVATRRRFRILAVSFLMGLVFVFPFADAFRYSLQGEFKSSGVVESLNSPDFDSFAQINNAVLYVDRSGPTDGKQLLGVVAFWVPRRLWPEKPVDTGIFIARDRGYEFDNLSAPLWAELYINGGWVLLILAMGAFGAIVSRLDARTDHDLRTRGTLGILACILPFYLMILLRGSLLQAMSYLTLIVFFTVVVSLKAVRGHKSEEGSYARA